MLSRRHLADASRRSTPNPRRLILLQTLCRRQNTQLLWNQANPNSFAKTPEVGVPRFSFQPRTAHYPPLTTHSLLSTFRMNTCKSVSKQSTLTTFRMNTYAKRGGGGTATPVSATHYSHPLLTFCRSGLPSVHYPLLTFLATASRRDRKRPWPGRQRAQNKWFRANCHSADAPPLLAA